MKHGYFFKFHHFVATMENSSICLGIWKILKRISLVLIDIGMKIIYIQVAVERVALAVRWNQVFHSAAFFSCIFYI